MFLLPAPPGLGSTRIFMPLLKRESGQFNMKLTKTSNKKTFHSKYGSKCTKYNNESVSQNNLVIH